MRHSKHVERAQRGFTLIETMVAMVIFLIGMAGVFALQAAVANQNRNANDISVASNLVSEGLELLKMANYNDVVGVSACPAPNNSWRPLCYFAKQGQAYTDGDPESRSPLTLDESYFRRSWAAVQNVGLQVTDVTVRVEWPGNDGIGIRVVTMTGRLFPR